MTPKKKAKELVDSHLKIYKDNVIGEFYLKRAIEHSLLCVSEILEVLNKQIMQTDSLDVIYWQKVEQELKDNFN